MPRSRVLKSRPTSFPGAKFDPCPSCHHQNQETYEHITCYTSPKPGTHAVNSLLPQDCATITGIPKMTASQPASQDRHSQVSLQEIFQRFLHMVSLSQNYKLLSKFRHSCERKKKQLPVCAFEDNPPNLLQPLYKLPYLESGLLSLGFSAQPGNIYNTRHNLRVMH
jgi:hypothetical protein